MVINCWKNPAQETRFHATKVWVHYKCRPLVCVWGGAHGVTWCWSADPETACVFLGRTSGEHTHKKSAIIWSSRCFSLPRLFLCVQESLCHPVFCVSPCCSELRDRSHCKYYRCCANWKTPHVEHPLTSVLLLAGHFLAQGYQSQAMTTKTGVCICCISTSAC